MTSERKPWLPYEDKRLKRLRNDGKTWRFIAQSMGRTIHSCEARHQRLVGTRSGGRACLQCGDDYVRQGKIGWDEHWKQRNKDRAADAKYLKALRASGQRFENWRVND